MLIRRMYLSIKRECVALIIFLFCGFLFTETRKETVYKKCFPFTAICVIIYKLTQFIKDKEGYYVRVFNRHKNFWY